MKYRYCCEPFDLDKIYLPEGTIVLDHKIMSEKQIFLWYLRPVEQPSRREELEAIQWLWKQSTSKCGIEDEMTCDEHDTCEQRRLVRKAFPFLEDVKQKPLK